jgi:hypothetical protein
MIVHDKKRMTQKIQKKYKYNAAETWSENRKGRDPEALAEDSIA